MAISNKAKMFKPQIENLIYYSETEDHLDKVKYMPETNGFQAYKLTEMQMAGICIDEESGTVIKNRVNSIQQLVECGITLEEPRDEITIVVNGRAGSGKTRIGALITKLLHERGFKISMEFKEEYPYSVYCNLDTAIDQIKGKVKIVVKEKQLSRSGALL